MVKGSNVEIIENLKNLQLSKAEKDTMQMDAV